MKEALQFALRLALEIIALVLGYSIPPLIEYRPWTGFVFNSGNMQYAGAYHTVSYSKKVATCTRFIL